MQPSDKHTRHSRRRHDPLDASSDVSLLQAQLEDAHRTKHELMEKYERNMNDLREYYESEIRQMKETNQTSQHDRAPQHHRRSSFKDDGRGDSRTMSALESALHNSEDTVMKLRKQLEDHRKMTSQLQDKMDRDQAGLLEKLAKAEDANLASRRREEETRAALGTIKKEKSLVEKQLSQALEELEILTKQAEGMGGNMNKVLDKFSDIDAQLRAKSNECEELRQQLDRKENEIVDVQIQLEDANRDLEHYKNENDTLRSQLEHIEKRKEEHAIAIHSATVETQSIQKQYADMSTKYREISDRMAEQEEYISSLREDLADAKAKLRETCAERDRLAHDFALSKRSQLSLETETSQQREIIASMRRELQAMAKLNYAELKEDVPRRPAPINTVAYAPSDVYHDSHRDRFSPNLRLESFSPKQSAGTPTPPISPTRGEDDREPIRARPVTQPYAPHVPLPSRARGLESSFDLFTGEANRSMHQPRRTDFARSKPFSREQRPPTEQSVWQTTSQKQYSAPVPTDLATYPNHRDSSRSGTPTSYSRETGQSSKTSRQESSEKDQTDYDGSRWRVPIDHPVKPVIQPNAASQRPPSPATTAWTFDREASSRGLNPAELEKKLMELSLEKNKVESELNHLSRAPMKAMQKRRAKEDLETNLARIESEVQSVRRQLRQLHVL
eukprot:TRINITY_DN8992_c0_g1_i3.p1 TRINITY_DN8992_c0_g1~~TRINITY_DN8992_c0_g1_i3.p1  ORF type:complete len:690 (+),score=129.90 TRINITY_DN8992_c0_g1_i3:49-2070(+)